MKSPALFRSPRLAAWRCAVLVALWPLGASSPAPAQTTPTYTLLHSFTGPSGDGGAPVAGLVESTTKATFYGCTSGNSLEYGNGTIYKVTPAKVFATLYSFGLPDANGINATGYQPVTTLAIDGTNTLYGCCEYGGASTTGTIFKYNVALNLFTVLHTFSSVDGSGFNADGAHPAAALLLAKNGKLYGTTQSGGASGVGTLFAVTTSGQFTLIHTFGVTTGDGTSPLGPLTQNADGSLIGTTSFGGNSSDGCVYKLVPIASHPGTFTYSILRSLSGPDGRYPESPLTVGSDGLVYFTTYYGGGNDLGCAVSMTADGASATVLHSFTGLNDGEHPVGGLIRLSTGEVVGDASLGSGYGHGDIFRVMPDMTFSLIHRFRGPEGAQPEGMLIVGRDGALYGTTAFGGANGYGTAFKINNF